jgi:TonB family protein
MKHTALMASLLTVSMLAGGGTAVLPAAAQVTHAEQPVFDQETPPPDGDWRPHRLSRCRPHPLPSDDARAYLDEALDLFKHRGGGDAIALLDVALRDVGNQPWLLLMLAQMYLLAGQGEPHCLPLSGPAAPSGDWPRDRLRLLERADLLLRRLETLWPDDALVAFLLADVARARDDHESAADLDHAGRGRCTDLDSLEFVAGMRDLVRRPASVTSPIVPEYPESAARRRAQGEVVLDLLLDPLGRVATSEVIGRADRDLVRAAREALGDGGYQAAQVGYYPVWSWLRVSIRFALE